MVDKAIKPEVFSLDDPVPPFHIFQSNHSIDQFMFAAVHVIFFRFIQRLRDGICCFSGRNDRRQNIAFPAYDLVGIQPAGELFFPVGFLQALDFLLNFGGVGGNCCLHSGQFVLGHTTYNAAHIIVDFRRRVTVVSVDLHTEHTASSEKTT